MKLRGTWGILWLLALGCAMPWIQGGYKSVQRQSQVVWNGKKCAVALTYDDGLNIHLDKVMAVLESAGLRGTFYLTINRGAVRNRIEDWRAAAQRGHELGNHTLFHPCIAYGPQRDYRGWVKPEYDLSRYSVTRYADEILIANTFLKMIDGKDKRTLALPCGDDTAQRGQSVIPLVRDAFVGIRLANGENDNERLDVMRVRALSVDDRYSARDLIQMVKAAEQNRRLLVFLFHGVGGEHLDNVAADKHDALVRYLKSMESSIWTAPLIEILESVRRYQDLAAVVKATAGS